jgi:hypothetical protein
MKVTIRVKRKHKTELRTLMPGEKSRAIITAALALGLSIMHERAQARRAEAN